MVEQQDGPDWLKPNSGLAEVEEHAEAASPHPDDTTSPHSPEARRHRALSNSAASLKAGVAKGYKRVSSIEVVKRVAIGVFFDGTIHAGNLAYMAILSLFPFFITATALLSLVGRSEEGVAALELFLRTVPPSVADTLSDPVREVLTARSGWLLWLGALFGLWTVGSLIETIRDILRRAYGTQSTRAFWRYRLTSIGIIIGAVVLLLFSFTAQVLITGVQQTIELFVPQFGDWIGRLALSRLVPGLGLFVSLYLIFLSLTPHAYRSREYPKWPGAAMTTFWWIAVTAILPLVLKNLVNYDLTYGSLAGVMIALFFFWLVGLGLVLGAELNAALAETPEEHDMIGLADDRRRAHGVEKEHQEQKEHR